MPNLENTIQRILMIVDSHNIDLSGGNSMLDHNKGVQTNPNNIKKIQNSKQSFKLIACTTN